MSSEKIRTGTLTQMVVEKYGGSHGAEMLNKYIVLTQVASSTGGAVNTADVMVIGAWKSSGNEVDGFEVKVSRADWLNEVKNPDKCGPSKKYCHRWWLVISDANMVKDGELPEDWGMMAVVDGILTIIKKAPQLKPVPLAVDFVASLLRTDARESVPLDVHRDVIKDARREIKVEIEEQYEGLLRYVNWLHKFIGIKFEFKDNWQSPIKAWRGAFTGEANLRTYSDEEFAGLVKAAMGRNLDDIDMKLKWMGDYAQDVVKKVSSFRKDSRI